MAHRNDPDFTEKEELRSQSEATHKSAKTSMKEGHEKALNKILAAGNNVSSMEGPDKHYPFSGFSVKCPHGHQHRVVVGHEGKDSVHVYDMAQAEDSDPSPVHHGTMKSAMSYLSKKHKTKSESSGDGDD